MSVTLLKRTKEEVTFRIEIDSKAFEDTIIEEYRTATAGQKKTPETLLLSDRALLAQYPKMGELFEKALDTLLPSYYMDAIKELGLNPMTYPRVMPQESKLGGPCVVDIRIVLEPEIEINQYEGIEASYAPVLVTDDDVAQQLAGLRKQYNVGDDDTKLLAKIHADSIEALTSEICDSLQSMARDKTEFNKKEAIMKQLLDANPCALSEEVIEQQILLEIDQFRKQMGAQAMDNHMKSSGRTIDSVKREIRPRAEATVKENLLLAAIAKKIASKITEEDIKNAVQKHQNSFMNLVPDYESRRKQLEKTPGAIEQLEHVIRLEKAANHVFSKAVVRESKPLRILDLMPDYMKQS